MNKYDVTAFASIPVEFSSKMYNINIEDGTDCRKNYEFPNGRIKDKVVITISSKHKNDLTTKKWSW